MRAQAFQTRDQRVVETLTHLLNQVGDAGMLEKARARARALPAMLRRHGLMQVLLFLDSKGAANGDSAASTQNDGELARWLVAGLTSTLEPEEPDSPAAPIEPAAYAQELAGVDLFTYLKRWETAVEVSGWLKMLIEARCPRDQARAQSGSAAGGDAGS